MYILASTAPLPHPPVFCLTPPWRVQDLRNDVVAMVSEDEDDDMGGEQYGSDAGTSAEYQRRLWAAEPARRDDVLPFFVWSIVHDRSRSEVGLKAFLDVSFGHAPR